MGLFSAFESRRENMVASSIFLTLFGLFLVVMGVIVLRIIARMTLKWWWLRRDGVIVEGLIGTCSYTYYRNRRRPVCQVGYTYAYQGKTYAQQKEEVSEVLYRSLGQAAPDRKDAPRTFPLEKKQAASVRCVSHHPSVSRIFDPTRAAGSASNPVAAIITGIVAFVCGLGSIGLGLFLLLGALVLLLTKR
jgi:hypothetical protein